MKQNRRWIIPILILIALSIYINLPNHPGIHIGSYNKEIKTQLGLDLVGGVQALLEADLPPDVEVTAENMQTARRIIEDRVNERSRKPPCWNLLISGFLTLNKPPSWSTPRLTRTL
ncbi:MAG: hypothetical protein P8Y34_09460 [Anaerolineales bacterium]